MASTFGWGRYTGLKGRNIGMHSFGASAPLKDLLKHFGFTVAQALARPGRTCSRSLTA
jgi:transketolase